MSRGKESSVAMRKRKRRPIKRKRKKRRSMRRISKRQSMICRRKSTRKRNDRRKHAVTSTNIRRYSDKYSTLMYRRQNK